MTAGWVIIQTAVIPSLSQYPDDERVLTCRLFIEAGAPGYMSRAGTHTLNPNVTPIPERP